MEVRCTALVGSLNPNSLLLGNEGFQVRQIMQTVKYGGGLSHFFSPCPVPNGEGDGVGLKEVEL